MSECLFCDEFESRENTFLENDLFRARWDQIPVSPGHAEVVPKRHVQYFDQLIDEEKEGLLKFAGEVLALIRRTDFLVAEYERILKTASTYVKPYLEKALTDTQTITRQPDAFNHGLNDGADAGQTIPHLHYHLIPRWQGDVENPRGGIRRILGEDEYSNG
jgi:ATP adenylyltransferase